MIEESFHDQLLCDEEEDPVESATDSTKTIKRMIKACKIEKEEGDPTRTIMPQIDE